jgi:hypothetical protein
VAGRSQADLRRLNYLASLGLSEDEATSLSDADLEALFAQRPVVDNWAELLASSKQYIDDSLPAAVAGITSASMARTVISASTYTVTNTDYNKLLCCTYNNAGVGCQITVPTGLTWPTDAEMGILTEGGQVTILGTGTTDTVSIAGTAKAFKNSSDGTLSFNHTIVVPTIADHDTLFASSIVNVNANSWPTIPSGWVQVGNVLTQTSSHSCALWMYVDAPASLSGTSQTFVLSSGATRAYAMALVAVRGLDRLNPLDVTTGEAATSFTSPTVSAVTQGAVQLAHLFKAYGASPGTSPMGQPTPSLAGLDVADSFTTAGGNNVSNTFGHGSLTGVSPGTSVGGNVWPSGSTGGTRTILLRPRVTTGVTMRPNTRLKTAETYTPIGIKKRATDDYYVFGYTAA